MSSDANKHLTDRLSLAVVKTRKPTSFDHRGVNGRTERFIVHSYRVGIVPLSKLRSTNKRGNSTGIMDGEKTTGTRSLRNYYMLSYDFVVTIVLEKKIDGADIFNIKTDERL